MLAVPAIAQQPPSADDTRRATQVELDRLQSDIRTSDERLAALKAEVDALERDRVKISEQLVASAERARKLERDAGIAEDAIATLEAQAGVLRTSLFERRAVLAEVLASLQRMGRKPPPAVLVRPEDALGAVRSAILMGAILPELREQALKLGADLNALVSLRDRSARERDAYRTDLTALAEEKSRLELLMDERRRTKGDQQRALDDERRRAQDLAARATSLKDLIGRFESDADLARRQAEDARRKAEESRLAAPTVVPPKQEDRPQQVAPPAIETARLAPARPFADGRGRMPIPVAGETLRNFGEDDGSGLNLKGIQISARPRATVASPADGRVVYAGVFRSYGKVLIVNCGDGYHVVLVGMERTDVDIGQFVLAGEPVGEMGDRKPQTAPNADIKAGQPVLYVEFRKDGSPIDPAPWWAQTRDEKVRG